MIKGKHFSAVAAAGVLVGMSAPALAKDPVAAQANKVAAEAQDLQRETNELTAAVANRTDDNASYANTDNGYAANNASADTKRDNENDEDHGKWGLLGLLGLAGLLGLKRKDHDRHVHVDRNHDLGASSTRTGSTGSTTTRL